MKEYGATGPDRGYPCSPLLYNADHRPRGRARPGSGGVQSETGALVGRPVISSRPRHRQSIIDVDGQKQLLYLAAIAIAGLDPATGWTLWNRGHKTDWGLNISTPSGHPPITCSSCRRLTARGAAIELRQAGGTTTTTEKWFSRRMRVHIGTVIRVGDHAYGSSGDFGPAFISAVDMKTGNVVWQDRRFARAQLLYADGKAIDARRRRGARPRDVAPEGLKVWQKASVLENLSWTPPTLVGTQTVRAGSEEHRRASSWVDSNRAPTTWPLCGPPLSVS